MTDQKTEAELAAEKKAAEEAEAKAAAEAEAQDAEFEASLEGLSDEEKDQKRAEKQAQFSKTEIDYEAELAKEKKAREEAEEKLKLTQEKAKERWQQKKEEIDKDKVDLDLEKEDKPLTAKQLETILAKERQENQKIVQATRIEQIADSLATSKEEKELIVEIHKNRTFPLHLSLEEQVEEAYAIANRKRFIGERNEALRAARSKGMAGKDSATTYHEALPSFEPKLSAKDKSVITESGYLWNSTSRRYEKKLGSGKILVWSQKTGQTYLVKAK